MGQKVLDALLGVGKTLLPWIIDRVIKGDSPQTIVEMHKDMMKRRDSQREAVDALIDDKFPQDD